MKLTTINGLTRLKTNKLIQASSKTKGLLLTLLLLWGSVATGALQVSKNGKPLAEIVLPPNSHPAIEIAAQELQHWVEAISGAKLPIVSEPGAQYKSILLALTPLGYENDNEKLKGNDGYAVRHHPEGIIVIGSRPRGILNGVYRLLYRNSDIIWARPEAEYGTIYSHNTDLTLKETNYSDIPSFSLRGWQMSAPDEEQVKWQVRNGSSWWITNIRNFDDIRARYDSVRDYGGGHNLVGRYITEKKYFDTNPEFFPLRNGKRLRPSETRASTQLCFTLPKLQETFIKELESHVEAHPEFDIYRVMIEDNYNLCECDSCLAPIKLAGQIIDKDDKSFRSTQFFLWLNPIARHIKDKYGKDILTFGYFFTEPPPHCPVEPNIHISFCPIYKNSKYNITNTNNLETLEKFSGWVKITDKLIWREYYGLCYAFPRPIDTVAVDDWRYISKFGVDQTYSEMKPDTARKPASQKSWHINSLYFWVMANASWNPNQDVGSLRNDFLSRVYGTAAADVGEFYRLIEEQWNKIPGVSKWNDNAFANWNKYVFETGIVDQCRAALDRADSKRLDPNSKRMLEELRGVFDHYLELFEQSKIYAVQTRTPPEFDPDFTKGSWRDAPPNSTFLVNRDGEPYPQPTSIRVLYDQENIYFGFKCGHDNPSKMAIEEYNDGKNKFPDGECFEIFLEGIWRGNRHFTQMVVNPLNNRYGAVRSAKWQSHAKLSDDGWSGMITVTWQSLGLDPREVKSLQFTCIRQFMTPFRPSAAPTQYASIPGGHRRHSRDRASRLVFR